MEPCCIICQAPWRAKHLIPRDVGEKFCIHYSSHCCNRISDRKELKGRFNLAHCLEGSIYSGREGMGIGGSLWLFLFHGPARLTGLEV